MASGPLDAGGPAERGERYRVPAIAKAFDVLELLADAPRGLPMTAISRALGRSMGELYRIVQALESRGYVARNPLTDEYALTLKLFDLAHRHSPTRRLIETALPVMRDLAEETRQSAHLAVRHHLDIVVLASVESPLPMHYSVKQGALFPLWATSSGVVLLAHEPDDRCAALLAEIAALPDIGVPLDALRERVAAVRRKGGERIASTEVAGVVNLSAPVFDRSRQIAAALTVPHLSQRQAQATLDTCEAAVHGAARRLSFALGFPTLADGTGPGLRAPRA